MPARPWCGDPVRFGGKRVVTAPAGGLRMPTIWGVALVEVTLADGSVTQVPYPRVPPEPGIGSRRRHTMAREWLVSLSQAPTAERVQALAPLVGRFSPRSPLGRIASQLVAANQLPVCEDVVAVYLHRQAIQSRRMPPAPPAPIGPDTRARVLELIDEHWSGHGQGPTWSQLGAQVGLDRHEVAHLLRELNKAGAVTFTPAPGSLRRTANDKS